VCALCKGNHPASYKGSVYKEIQRRKKHHSNNAFLSDNSKFNIQTNHPTNNSPSNNTRSYDQATSSQHSTHPPPSSEPNMNKVMTHFLEEFKSLLNPLITQLTKVIFSLLDKKKND
jgi:hypothetical protein